MAGRESVAAAALTLRWGSYLAVLLDRDKPVWPEAGKHEPDQRRRNGADQHRGVRSPRGVDRPLSRRPGPTALRATREPGCLLSGCARYARYLIGEREACL